MNLEDLNEQQRAAATYEGRNLLVLAGAGTGKTRTIIARAKYLLNKGVRPAAENSYRGHIRGCCCGFEGSLRS